MKIENVNASKPKILRSSIILYLAKAFQSATYKQYIYMLSGSAVTVLRRGK